MSSRWSEPTRDRWFGIAYVLLGKCSATCRGCAALAWEELRMPRYVGRLRFPRRRFSLLQGVATRHEGSSGDQPRKRAENNFRALRFFVVDLRSFPASLIAT